MAQHFLLSAKARTLSLAKVMRLSDEEAYETFKAIRWAEADGEPVCPRCGSVAVYEYRSRKIYECQGCERQFSLTTDTIFASRKLSIRDLLVAIAIFVNGAKGYSALQLSRDLDCQYKTAFVLAHKLREAMGAEMADRKVSGHVEIDGAYFGGYVKPENRKADRKDLRLVENRSGKRRAVVVMRERQGNTLPFVFLRELRDLTKRQLRQRMKDLMDQTAEMPDSIEERLAARERAANAVGLIGEVFEKAAEEFAERQRSRGETAAPRQRKTVKNKK